MNDMVSIIASLDAAQRMADAQYRAFVCEGIDAVERGDVITRAGMEIWFEERIAAHRPA